jgi:pimeloyl-ACP methyl ester carboxylesterase
MKTLTNAVTSRDGTLIAFESVGTGPAVVLVDGAMCSRSFGPTAAIADALKDRFTVYRYDRRGRGESGDTQPYAVAREIEDLEAVIREAGGSACVLGISSGAGLALEAAASGVPIAKLALFEPPYTADRSDPARRKEEAAHMDALLADGRRGDAVELFLGWVGMPDEAIAQMRGSPMWPLLEATAPTISYDDRVMGDGTVPRERAGRISVPTVLIHGSESADELQRATREVADSIPDAQLRTLAGQSHQADPETLAPVLKEFFA